jgi:cystathionine beta-synthase
MSRRLIREEGLLCGGSCGAAMAAALEIAKDLPEDKRVVCIFVDSVRNYMTKFLNDDWMLENDFYSQKEYDEKYFTKDVNMYGDDKLISDLGLSETAPVSLSTIVREVLVRFENEKIECVRIEFNNIFIILI